MPMLVAHILATATQVVAGLVLAGQCSEVCCTWDVELVKRASSGRLVIRSLTRVARIPLTPHVYLPIQPAVPPRPAPPSPETLAQVTSQSSDEGSAGADVANVMEPTRPPPPSPGTLAKRVSLIQLDGEPEVTNTTV